MTLRALGVDRADGGVKVLALPEPPQPGPGQVSIAVVGAGMGPWDRLLYTGGWGERLRCKLIQALRASSAAASIGHMTYESLNWPARRHITHPGE
jgi:hypothetical protein